MPFFMKLFHDRVRIYGYDFQQFFTVSGFIDMVFLIHLLMSFISRFMGIIFRKFSGFMDGIFMI